MTKFKNDDITSSGPSPQEDWLERLNKASNYNGWIFRNIEPYLCGTALEVGCGTGSFSSLIAGVVEQLTAIDISEGFIEVARSRLAEIQNISLVHGDATQISGDQSYDSIILLDVLEHIADDAAMLTSLARNLSPGGRIILKIPAIPRLFNSLDTAVGHYRRYDRQTLASVAEAAGCRLSHCQSFNIAGIPGWWWNGLQNRAVAPRAQIGGFDKLVPLLAFGERNLPEMPGLSLIAILEANR